jgi:hypothetical protein
MLTRKLQQLQLCMLVARISETNNLVFNEVLQKHRANLCALLFEHCCCCSACAYRDTPCPSSAIVVLSRQAPHASVVAGFEQRKQ